jgi:hypothetical protein
VTKPNRRTPTLFNHNFLPSLPNRRVPISPSYISSIRLIRTHTMPKAKTHLKLTKKPSQTDVSSKASSTRSGDDPPTLEEFESFKSLDKIVGKVTPHYTRVDCDYICSTLSQGPGKERTSVQSRRPVRLHPPNSKGGC